MNRSPVDRRPTARTIALPRSSRDIRWATLLTLCFGLTMYALLIGAAV